MNFLKKTCRIIGLSLLFASIIFQNLLILAAEPDQEKKIIKEPYQYAIQLDSFEWNSLDTHEKKMAACQIPDKIVKNMTTEALVETVMSYPLLVDMFLFSSENAGYQAVYRTFNGLQELESRTDAVTEIKNYLTKINASNKKNIDKNKLILAQMYEEALIDGINARNKSKEELEGRIAINPSRASTANVYTPNGTAVQAIYDKTWNDAINTELQLQVIQNQISTIYPQIILLRSYNIKYNCHSYAWHSTYFNNKYWIIYPYEYMNDGSYTQTSASSGTKIFYDSVYGSAYDHSGVVAFISGGEYYIMSKWGEAGLYLHKTYDCPYSSFSPTCSFWTR